MNTYVSAAIFARRSLSHKWLFQWKNNWIPIPIPGRFQLALTLDDFWVSLGGSEGDFGCFILVGPGLFRRLVLLHIKDLANCH